MRSLLARLFDDESGQTLFEYAMLGFFIAVLVVGTLAAVQGGLDSMLNSIAGMF